MLSENKFWTIKDTLNYKKYTEGEVFKKKKVARTFEFETSFLLRVKNNGSFCYVIPLAFISSNYPRGFYKGLAEDGKILTFNDCDIDEVL